MNLIRLNSFKRAQLILRINSFLLFILIITTPAMVSTGFWGIPEFVIEGIFLSMEIFVLIQLFRRYDFQSNKNVDKVDYLGNKLRQQQKVLADSLEYLGKMNVQMSILKKTMSKIKIPTSINKLDKVIKLLLESISRLSGNGEIAVKIINSHSDKVLKEFYYPSSKLSQEFKKKLNKIDVFNDKFRIKSDLMIVVSNYDSFSLKTYAVIFTNKKNKKKVLNEQQLDLIQGLVNQCEIMFLLYNSRYYLKREK